MQSCSPPFVCAGGPYNDDHAEAVPGPSSPRFRRERTRCDSRTDGNSDADGSRALLSGQWNFISIVDEPRFFRDDPFHIGVYLLVGAGHWQVLHALCAKVLDSCSLTHMHALHTYATLTPHTNTQTKHTHAYTTHAHARADTHTHAHAYIHAYTHTLDKHIHTQTHTHTHTPTPFAATSICS